MIVNPKGDWLIRLINRLNWRHTTHKVNTYTKEFYCVTPDVLEVIPELNELSLAPKGIKIVHIIDKEASVTFTFTLLSSGNWSIKMF